MIINWSKGISCEEFMAAIVKNESFWKSFDQHTPIGCLTSDYKIQALCGVSIEHFMTIDLDHVYDGTPNALYDEVLAIFYENEASIVQNLLDHHAASSDDFRVEIALVADVNL